MTIDVGLLNKVRKGLGKEAYAPPTPDPAMGGMPMTDPAMAAAGGMPPGGGMPMDPAMMAAAAGGAGMPPVDPMAMTPAMPMEGMAPVPGMPPVDPNTGLPPMDPAAGGMDPSMMAGGMPPMTPEGGGEVVQVSMDDLRAILQEATGGGEDAAPEAKGGVEERLGELEEMMMVLMQGLGMGEEMPAPEEIPAGAEGMIPPAVEQAPAGMPAEVPVQGLPQDFSLLEAPEEMAMPEQKAAASKDANVFLQRLRQSLAHV